MAKGKAESLDDVLELARMRRQNGMVTIEHTQGDKVDEGEVFFETGQPIQLSRTTGWSGCIKLAAEVALTSYSLWELMNPCNPLPQLL